jgi:hypothetical protein
MTSADSYFHHLLQERVGELGVGEEGCIDQRIEERFECPGIDFAEIPQEPFTVPCGCRLPTRARPAS